MPTCHPQAGEPADRPCCRSGRLFIQQCKKLCQNGIMNGNWFY